MSGFEHFCPCSQESNSGLSINTILCTFYTNINFSKSNLMIFFPPTFNHLTFNLFCFYLTIITAHFPLFQLQLSILGLDSSVLLFSSFSLYPFSLICPRHTPLSCKTNINVHQGTLRSLISEGDSKERLYLNVYLKLYSGKTDLQFTKNSYFTIQEIRS